MKRKPAGNTPITGTTSPPKRIVPNGVRCPIWSRQNAYETITPSPPPTAFSESVNSRPTSGLTPSTLKNWRDTPTVVARTGSAPAPTDTVAGGANAVDTTPLNDFAWSRQSEKFGYDGGRSCPSAVRSRRNTRRPAASYGNGRSSTVSSTVNAVVVAPTPSARVISASVEKPGCFRSDRAAHVRS